MAQLYQRAKVQALALKAVVGWIEEEAKNVMVHRDRDLQKKVMTARQYLKREDTSEKDILELSRGLYLALAEARRRAVGISRQ
jgi:hypothetical protein